MNRGMPLQGVPLSLECTPKLKKQCGPFMSMPISNCDFRQKGKSRPKYLPSAQYDCRRSLYSSPYRRSSVPGYENTGKSERFREHPFSMKFLQSAWPMYCLPPFKLTEMNVQETSIWVFMLSGFKGWKETRTYSKKFKNNNISGYMLPSLTAEILRDDLGIKKLGHRLEIVTAIDYNELTLMNPVVLAFNPNTSFKFDQKEVMSDCKPRKKEFNVKCFSNAPKKSFLQSHNRALICPRKAGLSSFHSPNWMCDPEDHGFSISNNCHCDPVGESVMTCGEESRFNDIPQIELHASSFDYSDKERSVASGIRSLGCSSPIFSSEGYGINELNNHRCDCLEEMIAFE